MSQSYQLTVIMKQKLQFLLLILFVPFWATSQITEPNSVALESGRNQNSAMETLKTQIKESLVKINSEGGNVNYVIFYLDNGYFVQTAGGKGTGFFRNEASTNDEFNSMSKDLTSTQRNKLLELGWEYQESEGPNYYMWYVLESDDQIDDLVDIFVHTIIDVYHSNSISKIDLHLE